MAVLMSFIAMKLFGVDANIMSLAGIAIAIGTMVDMGIIILENIYEGLSNWESEGFQGGAKQRLVVIRDSAAEVVPAVLTAVSTTVVSFLPVFMLTGRDHRLFAPLAWTKTYALISSLIVAVIIVPMLCRLFLKSAKTPRWFGILPGIGVGFIFGGLGYFVWGDEIKHLTHVSLPLATLILSIAGFVVGWLTSRERIRSMEANPTSRFVRFLYAGRLRLALNHKFAMLSLPAVLMLLGLGAYFGLPKVLLPLERIGSTLGTDFNEVPGYVKAKHTFTGLQSDDWIALDEGSWFYMPSLYPAASFSQAMTVLQTQDTLIKGIPEVENVLGKIGRVESALDPAPAAMIETYVMLKPESEWREGVTARDVWDEINRVATLPGVTPASALQPIEGEW